MNLTIVTTYGKKVNLIAPGITTREKLSELYGDSFQMDIYNQNSAKYNVKQVLAEPSKDTTWISVIIVFLIALCFFKDETISKTIFYSIATSYVVYIYRLIVVELDKRAVQKFNNS